jgi:hypothetical protein
LRSERAAPPPPKWLRTDKFADDNAAAQPEGCAANARFGSHPVVGSPTGYKVKCQSGAAKIEAPAPEFRAFKSGESPYSRSGRQLQERR